MARTQAADYDQRREAILDRAAELFARKGFNGASISELAKACDTSKSLIYHYYPSKEDILYGVMASHVEALVEAIKELAPAREAPADVLRALVRRFMELYVGAADRQKVLLNELDNLPADRRADIVAKQRRVLAAVSRLVSSLQPALAVDSPRLTVTTMLLFGMINWTKTWFDPDGPIKAPELAELAADIMLSGVSGLDHSTGKVEQTTSRPKADSAG
jgi:AcrR family transcriptional regulator